MGITSKQKKVLNFIELYIEEKHHAPTQREIRDYMGLKSFGSVQRYIKYLTDGGYLERNWNARRGLKILRPEDQVEETSLQIPLLGRVAAGVPLEAIECCDHYIPIPVQMLKGQGPYFALTVTGESMIEDGILDGDTVVFRSQETAHKGQTVVAIVEGEATLKHYFPKPDCIELHPANHTMKPLIVTRGDFRLAGVMIGLIRTYE